VNKKILLVKPRNDVFRIIPPLGLGYLSSSLKKNNFDTEIIDCNSSKLDISDIIKKIEEEKIEYVGITVCSNEHNWLKKFCNAFFNNPSLKIIVGGPHPTGLKSRLLSLIPRIDFIIFSEGEISLPLLIKSLEKRDRSALKQIPNLIWRDNEKIIENYQSLPPNLDELELPDWEQISPIKYQKFPPHGGFAMETPVAQIITTRGCPCACEYCAGHIVNGTKIRKRSADSIVNEIEYLVEHFGVKEIHIEDDNFTFSKAHVLSLCKAIKSNNIKLKFGLPNGIRLDRLDDEILFEMYSCGFYFFSVGIESGSERILKKMHKALTIEKIESGLKLIRKYPFQVKGFFMLGYPSETVVDINETIKLSTMLDLDQAFFSLFVPIPGTKAFTILEKTGEIDINTCDWDNFYTGKNSLPPYIPETLSIKDLKRASKRAFMAFYFRPKIAFSVLRRINGLREIKSIFRIGKSLLLKK
jgi:anaerobic magnesium-protoporphyrin IX monomethyl ester cyclase